MHHVCMLARTLLVDGIQLNTGWCEPTNRSSQFKVLGPHSPFFLERFAVDERRSERRCSSVLPATRLTGSAEVHMHLCCRWLLRFLPGNPIWHRKQVQDAPRFTHKNRQMVKMHPGDHR